MKMNTKQHSVLCLALIATIAAFSACAQTTEQKSDIDKLIGNWSGQSTCVNKEKFPACNDEKVVYQITKVANKPGTVNLSADRITDGKPVFMGAFDFTYDADKKLLTSEFKNERVHLSLEFVVKDEVLEGGIYSLPDRIQSRSIKVKKDKDPKP
jgi:hypothetical protein